LTKRAGVTTADQLIYSSCNALTPLSYESQRLWYIKSIHYAS